MDLFRCTTLQSPTLNGFRTLEAELRRSDNADNPQKTIYSMEQTWQITDTCIGIVVILILISDHSTLVDQFVNPFRVTTIVSLIQVTVVVSMQLKQHIVSYMGQKHFYCTHSALSITLLHVLFYILDKHIENCKSSISVSSSAET